MCAGGRLQAARPVCGHGGAVGWPDERPVGSAAGGGAAAAPESGVPVQPLRGLLLPALPPAVRLLGGGGGRVL